MKFRFFLGLFLLTHESCCINEPYSNTNNGEIIKSISLDSNNFFILNYISEDEEIVFRNKESFQKFIKKIESENNCDINDSISIDWNKYSIIGKKIVHTGCNGYFEREVYRNENELVYKIKKRECGDCESIVASDNLVLVPKIPERLPVRIIIE